MLNTIDLVFQDGIDWQAFFQAFKEIRDQRPHDDLAIQAIEKKKGGIFVVRLEVSHTTDKSEIESGIKEAYKKELLILEQKYQDLLNFKNDEILAHREHNSNLMKITELLARNSDMGTSQYDLRGAQFSGGFAETVQGNQIGASVSSQESARFNDIQLLRRLRERIEYLPSDYKSSIVGILNDLEAISEDADSGQI